MDMVERIIKNYLFGIYFIDQFGDCLNNNNNFKFFKNELVLLNILEVIW